MRTLATLALAGLLSSSCAQAPRPVTQLETEEPCSITREQREWLFQDIYPRMARDIPRIIAKGWATAVGERDLYHAHVYVYAFDARESAPPAQELRDTYRRDIAFLYHSKERLNDPKDRNIYVGPGRRFEAFDDRVEITRYGGWLDEETGAILPEYVINGRIPLGPTGKEVIQVNVGTSLEGLTSTFSHNAIDGSSVASVGPYWFGVYKEYDASCR